MQVTANFNLNGNRLFLKDDKEIYLTIDNTDYVLFYIKLDRVGNKGSHSNVFRLYLAQGFTNLEESRPVKAIKVSNVQDSFSEGKFKKNPNNYRFYREIQALNECKSKGIDNVIKIDSSGHIECRVEQKNRMGIIKERSLYYPYYVMDFADGDLMSFLEDNPNCSESERIELCLQLAKGLNELNELGYYHRDIKPDNILMIDNSWKLGDLGLVASRTQDFDEPREWIGPRGWMSPESMNKYLAEGVEGRNFDCKIDHQSDIFQLGKLFWYILQGNAPIGCISRKDFLIRNEPIYALIRTMLNYSKNKRIPNMPIVVNELERIARQM